MLRQARMSYIDEQLGRQADQRNVKQIDSDLV